MFCNNNAKEKQVFWKKKPISITIIPNKHWMPTHNWKYKMNFSTYHLGYTYTCTHKYMYIHVHVYNFVNVWEAFSGMSLIRTPWIENTSLIGTHLQVPTPLKLVHNNHWNQDTSLIRTLSSVPSVSGLEKFQCVCVHACSTYLQGQCQSYEMSESAYLEVILMSNNA